MTTSKCFKSMTKFAFLMAVLAAGVSAQASQGLALQENESVKIACPRGLSPVLQGDVVQCGQICKMDVFELMDYGNCDQGGCVYGPTSFTVTLTGSKSETPLYKGSFQIWQESKVLEKLKADFSESCKLIQTSVYSE